MKTSVQNDDPNKLEIFNAYAMRTSVQNDDPSKLEIFNAYAIPSKTVIQVHFYVREISLHGRKKVPNKIMRHYK